MKKTNRAVFIVFSILLTAISFVNVFADSTCLNEKGKPYPANAPADSLCYQYIKELGIWFPNGATKGQTGSGKPSGNTQQDELQQLIQSVTQPQQPQPQQKQDPSADIMQLYQNLIQQNEAEGQGQELPADVLQFIQGMIPQQQQELAQDPSADLIQLYQNFFQQNEAEGQGQESQADIMQYYQDLAQQQAQDEDPQTPEELIEYMRLLAQQQEQPEQQPDPDVSQLIPVLLQGEKTPEPTKTQPATKVPVSKPTATKVPASKPTATPIPKVIENLPEVLAVPVDSSGEIPEELRQLITSFTNGETQDNVVVPIPEELLKMLPEGSTKANSSGSSTDASLEELMKALMAANQPQGRLKNMTQVSPNGSTERSSNVNFRWTYTVSDPSRPVNVAFTLYLIINDLRTGDVRAAEITVPASACSNNTCTYTASKELAGLMNAAVFWTVAGVSNDTITIPDNPGANFTINTQPTKTPKPPRPVHTPTPTPERPDPRKPEAPIPQYPSGNVTSRAVGFYWKPSKNAERYTVEWLNEKHQYGAVNLSNNDPSCRKGLCAAFATVQGNGDYTWIVTAKNPYGSARSYEMYFSVRSNISTPTAYRPNGTVYNSSNPAFEWSEVREGVIEYRIQVIGKYDNRIRLDNWYNAKDVYTGNGTCYVRTDVFLPSGSYSWRVMARNADSTSGWSGWCDFYVECNYCNSGNPYYNNYSNTVPSCSYPLGTITEATPSFQWRTLTGASYYMVTLYDNAGQILFDNYVASGNCTVELCTHTPNYKLPKNGSYSWTVSGYGANGSRWGSANGSFTLNAAVVMNPMSFIQPAQNGILTNENPKIIWTDPGQTTASFHIEIFSGANVRLFNADLNRDQAWCNGQTCTIEFKTIPDGENYLITITPYSEMNSAGETISLVFNKGGIPLRLESPKENTVVSSRPLFRWKLDAGTQTRYELVLTDQTNNVLTYSPLVCGAVGVTCDGGEAYFSPAEPLNPGSYRARIVVSGSNSYMSEETHFTIQ